MENIKKSFNLITIGSMVVDFLTVILGLFLIANPSVGAESTLMLIGILLVITGIYSIIKFIMNSRSIFRFELIFGVLSLIAGCFAFFKPFAVASLLAILVGVWLIVSSLIKLSIAIELKKNNEESWIFDLTVAILTLILGVLILINPFKGYMGLTIYIGIMIIIYSAMDIIEQAFIRKRVATITKLFK